MQYYNFTAYGRDFKVTVSDSHSGSGSGRLQAMEAANKKLSEMPEHQHGSGAWFPSDGCNYCWIEGNFFD
jgi:hypothetical protein